MSHLTHLKEHIIHLMDDADEGTIMGLVKYLETGADGKPLLGTPRGGGGNNKNAKTTNSQQKAEDVGSPLVDFGGGGASGDAAAGGFVPTRGARKSVTISTDNPLASEAPTQQHRHGSMLSDSQNSESSGSHYCRRDTGVSVDSGISNDTIAAPMDAAELDGSTNQRGRRAGVSAAPMATFLQDQEAKQTFEARVVPKSEEQWKTCSEMCAKNVMFFPSMDERDQKTIVDALDHETFGAGAEILTQGQVPNPAKLYVVFEGTCEVVIDGKWKASLVPGNTFGELEMMYSSPCKATIRAVTDCVMYSLDQATYQVIVYGASKAKREQFTHLVKQVTFLEALTDYDKTTLAEALTTKDFYAGEYLIRFGERGDNMFIIMEGEVQVVGRDKGKKVDVIKLGPDNVVGELEFLFDHSTIADVVAISKRVKTATISRKHFEMCVGITDDLKQFVAKKGDYQHYLKEADDRVKKEIELFEKGAKRVDAAGSDLKIEKLDHHGELILAQEVGSRDNKKKVAYRYPLRPLQDRTTFFFFGVREDDTVMFWSEGMESITGFRSNEVIGRSVHILFSGNKDQTNFHSAIHEAAKLAGKIDDDYLTSLEAKTYTFQRRDGLTKVKFSLRILPPLVAHGKNVPEMMLVMGEEVKQEAPQMTTDYSHWVTDQIRSIINDNSEASGDGDAKLAKINQTLVKFEKLQRTAQHVDSSKLQVLNLRQLVGSLLTDFAGEVISRGLSVTQHFAELTYEEVYCDPVVLPNCLRQVMLNCLRHLPNAGGNAVRIICSQIEEHTVEFLQVEFTDNGNGFSNSVIAAFNAANGKVGSSNSLIDLKDQVEGLGGEMIIGNIPKTPEDDFGGGSVVFKFPFFPYTAEDDSDGVDLATSTSTSGTGAVVLNKALSYTSLVVEDHPAYRNRICASLWERKHAVLPGYNWEDIELRKDLADILFIDASQTTMCSDLSKIMQLAKMAENTMAVIITGEHIPRAIEEFKVFLTLTKPFSAKQFSTVVRKAEEQIYKMKADKEKINATRAAFNQNSRTGNYVLGKMLGKGAFGAVYEATDAVTGGIMAVKLLTIDNAEKRLEVVNEIEVMCTLNHPNIIHYLYAQDDAEKNQIKVIMEYASGGTLNELMAKRLAAGEPFSMPDYVSMMRNIVEGVAYIHSQNIIHRDLKTPNILLDANGKGKLGDFGTAKRLKDQDAKLYDFCGTLLYMAPEIHSAGEIIPHNPDDAKADEDLTEADGVRSGYSFPADIWSLGCIALELATGKAPFAHLGLVPSIAGMTNFAASITEANDVPDLSPLFDKPPEIIEFVSACLQPDPSKRLKASQLLEHNLFQEGSSEEKKTALKALKRAQLMAVLNAFVAFQEPEELEAKRQEEEEARRVREMVHNPVMAKKAEDDFFADSDDEDEDDDDDDGSDDDGSDDDDSGKQKASSPTSAAAPAGVPHASNSGSSSATPSAPQSPTSAGGAAFHVVGPLKLGKLNNNNNSSASGNNTSTASGNIGPTPPNSGRARPISFGVSDGPSPSTPRGLNSNNITAASAASGPLGGLLGPDSPTARTAPTTVPSSPPTQPSTLQPYPSAAAAHAAAAAHHHTGGGGSGTPYNIPKPPPLNTSTGSHAAADGNGNGSNANASASSPSDALANMGLAGGGMSGLFQPLAFASDLMFFSPTGIATAAATDSNGSAAAAATATGASGGGGKEEEEKACASSDNTATATAGGGIKPTASAPSMGSADRNHVKGTTPPLRPSSAAAVTGGRSGSPAVLLATAAAASSPSAGAMGMGVGVVPTSPTSTVSDQLIISLHDALLMLVDELTRTNSKVRTSDALKEQYDAIRMRREQSPPYVGGGNSGAATTLPPSAAASASEPNHNSVSANSSVTGNSGGGGGGSNFKPDIDKLLEADVAFVKNVVAALATK